MHKRTHAANARKLLESNDDSALAYVALELRMAMEAIVYDKLRAYSARLPPEVMDKWQPPQALKALLQFEPGAADEGVVTIGKQSGSGIPATKFSVLGEKRAFNPVWLRTSYNKLGSLLHLPSPSRSAKATSSEGKQKTRNDLTAILDEVERVAASTLEGGMATVISFSCDVCERKVLCNEESLRLIKRAVCLESSCSAEHYAEFGDDGSVTLFLDATGFDCISCRAVTPVQNRFLEVGFRFNCEKCGLEHFMQSIHWEYGAKTGGPAPDV